jgi:uncharacterized protein YpmB
MRSAKKQEQTKQRVVAIQKLLRKAFGLGNTKIDAEELKLISSRMDQVENDVNMTQAEDVVDFHMDDDYASIGLDKENTTELVAVGKGTQKLQSFKRTMVTMRKEFPRNEKLSEKIKMMAVEILNI